MTSWADIEDDEFFEEEEDESPPPRQPQSARDILGHKAAAPVRPTRAAAPPQRQLPQQERQRRGQPAPAQQRQTTAPQIQKVDAPPAAPVTEQDLKQINFAFSEETRKENDDFFRRPLKEGLPAMAPPPSRDPYNRPFVRPQEPAFSRPAAAAAPPPVRSTTPPLRRTSPTPPPRAADALAAGPRNPANPLVTGPRNMENPLSVPPRSAAAKPAPAPATATGPRAGTAPPATKAAAPAASASGPRNTEQPVAAPGPRAAPASPRNAAAAAPPRKPPQSPVRQPQPQPAAATSPSQQRHGAAGPSMARFGDNGPRTRYEPAPNVRSQDPPRRRGNDSPRRVISDGQGFVVSLREAFGFIEPLTDSEHVFFHFSKVLGNSDALSVGAEVSYKFCEEMNGKTAARDVKILEKGTLVLEEVSEERYDGVVRSIPPTDRRGIRSEYTVEVVPAKSSDNDNDEAQTDKSDVGAKDGDAKKESTGGDKDDAGTDGTSTAKNSRRSYEGKILPLRERDLVEVRELVEGERVSFHVSRHLKTNRTRAVAAKLVDTPQHLQDVGLIATVRGAFGFISPLNHNGDVYFVTSHVTNAAESELEVGANVSFVMATDARGKVSARRVKVLPKGSVSFERVGKKTIEGVVMSLSRTEGTILYGRRRLQFDPAEVDCESLEEEDVVSFQIATHVRTRNTRAVNVKFIRRPERVKGTGVIASLKPEFGFIRCCECDEDMFFHFSNVKSSQDQITLDAEVSYVIREMPDKRRMAIDVEVLPKGSVSFETVGEEWVDGTIAQVNRSSRGIHGGAIRLASAGDDAEAAATEDGASAGESAAEASAADAASGAVEAAGSASSEQGGAADAASGAAEAAGSTSTEQDGAAASAEEGGSSRSGRSRADSDAASSSGGEKKRRVLKFSGGSLHATVRSLRIGDGVRFHIATSKRDGKQRAVEVELVTEADEPRRVGQIVEMRRDSGAIAVSRSGRARITFRASELPDELPEESLSKGMWVSYVTYSVQRSQVPMAERLRAAEEPPLDEQDAEKDAGPSAAALGPHPGRRETPAEDIEKRGVLGVVYMLPTKAARGSGRPEWSPGRITAVTPDALEEFVDAEAKRRDIERAKRDRDRFGSRGWRRGDDAKSAEKHEDGDPNDAGTDSNSGEGKATTQDAAAGDESAAPEAQWPKTEFSAPFVFADLLSRHRLCARDEVVFDVAKDGRAVNIRHATLQCTVRQISKSSGVLVRIFGRKGFYMRSMSNAFELDLNPHDYPAGVELTEGDEVTCCPVQRKKKHPNAVDVAFVRKASRGASRGRAARAVIENAGIEMLRYAKGPEGDSIGFPKNRGRPGAPADEPDSDDAAAAAESDPAADAVPADDTHTSAPVATE